MDVERRTSGVCELCGCPQVEWLRTATVARALGVPARTVRYWCEQGHIYARHVGRAWRINHGSLDSFLANPQIK